MAYFEELDSTGFLSKLSQKCFYHKCLITILIKVNNYVAKNITEFGCLCNALHTAVKKNTTF